VTLFYQDVPTRYAKLDQIPFFRVRRIHEKTACIAGHSILPLLASCGQNNSTSWAQLNFSIAIPAQNSSAKVVAAPVADICAEYGIDNYYRHGK
jgi:hypothetical protein